MRQKIIEAAIKEWDVKELPGEAVNSPRILEYFSAIGHQWVKTDETAWCSAFVNYIAKKTGYEYSGALNARSWLTVGKSINTPEIGDIVVLWRESITSWKGHVGLFWKQDRGLVYIYGGNQGNKVCVRPYDIDRVLDYRTLRKKEF